MSRRKKKISPAPVPAKRTVEQASNQSGHVETFTFGDPEPVTSLRDFFYIEAIPWKVF